MLALFVAGAIALVGRIVTWPPSQAIDDWAYTAWAQQLVRGERPDVAATATAPKPLTHLLAVVSLPLPSEWAFPIVVAVASAAVVAGVAAAAMRLGGPVAALPAVIAIVTSYGFMHNFQHADVDALTAALVVWAIATRGRARVALLVIAGLIHPEAWPAAAAAGYLEADGTRMRRLAMGVAAGAAAPLVWATTDLILNGVPFEFLVVGHRVDAHIGLQVTLAGLPEALWSALSKEAGTFVVLAGIAGLGVNATRAHRRGQLDPMPIVVVALSAGMLCAEFSSQLPNYARYTAPMAAVLAVGAGALMGEILPRPRLAAATWIATVSALCGLLVVIGTTAHIPQSDTPPLGRVVSSLTAIDRALRCGPIGVISRTTDLPARVIPMLAALSRQSLSRFDPTTPHAEQFYAAVLLPHGSGLPLRPGILVPLPVGTLSLTAKCANLAAGEGSP